MPSEPSTSYFDRQTGEVRTLAEPSDGALAFAYGTPVGRLLLKVMTSPWPSELWGRLMRSPLSRGRVARFCAQNGITNASLTRAGFAPMESYGSFAAFFERTRPVPCAGEPGVLYAPADGYLSCYRIAPGLAMDIKGTTYTVPELLGEPDATRYADLQGGLCLVFRLSLTDYHHFHFPAAGTCVSQRQIPGELHSVRPVAAGKRPFSRNKRSVSQLVLDGFGPAVMVEVGAMLVGGIVQDEPTPARFAAGAHKGHFALSGSTVVLLLRDNVILDPDIALANARGLETRVEAGTRIGRLREGVGNA